MATQYNFSSISPFPYVVTSVHTHFVHPSRSLAYPPALHGHPPFPLYDDVDVDDAHSLQSASQRRHPSSDPSRTSLHLMTRRTALVCDRYNKLKQTPVNRPIQHFGIFGAPIRTF